MESHHNSVENHYFKEQLFEEIKRRLTEQGVDLENVSREHIAGVDEFHVRGASVSKELAHSVALNGLKVLDVGCGLGGPCRMLADEFDCNCTGIDLSGEYIRTAIALSKLVGLDDKTTFLQGNALQLPFEEGTFDIVWTQHVQMNISDKSGFYSEIHRVLKPGGYFLYYDIFKENDEEVSYPMPWASTPDQSFLFKLKEMDSILDDLGLDQLQTTDQTAAGILFFEKMVAKPSAEGPPRIGLNVLMGASAKPKLMNLMSHLKEHKLALHSGAYKK